MSRSVRSATQVSKEEDEAEEEEEEEEGEGEEEEEEEEGEDGEGGSGGESSGQLRNKVQFWNFRPQRHCERLLNRWVGDIAFSLHLTEYVVVTSVQVDQPQRSFLIPTIRFWMLQALPKRTDPDVTTWEIWRFATQP